MIETTFVIPVAIWDSDEFDVTEIDMVKVHLEGSNL